MATNVNNTVLYTGVTNNLERRMYEHTNKLIPGFTSKYNVKKLVWYEEFSNPREAIAAEKRIKGWRREKKLELIRNFNHSFSDCIVGDSSQSSE
ncbi:MAG: GIY-YIG nuclease family protein [Candidatus Liptonbacteria bacterium]|nr:GIY-YIG nuclease family protein [Candidatus Liptonbacteria bacterium]